MSHEAAPLLLCQDCGMDEPKPGCSRCPGCQHDHEVRLALKLARQSKQEKTDA